MNSAAIELATHLATTRPAAGQSYGAHVAAAIAKWPDLTNDEINWAFQHAADICQRLGDRLHREARELRASTIVV
jgi:hypothetical protein